MSLAEKLYSDAFKLYDQSNFSNVSVSDGSLNDNNVVSIQWPIVKLARPQVDYYSRVFYGFKQGSLSADIKLTVINYNDVYGAWYNTLKSQMDQRLLIDKSAITVKTISFNDDAGNFHSLKGILTDVSALTFDKKISSSVPTFTLTFVPMSSGSI